MRVPTTASTILLKAALSANGQAHVRRRYPLAMHPAEEIAKAEQLLKGGYSNPYTAAMSERHEALQYLYTHPHLLFPLGYDEARVFHEDDVRTHTTLDAFCQQVSPHFKQGFEPFHSKPNCAVLREQSGKLWSMPYWILLTENDNLWATKADLAIIREDGVDREIDVQELITILNSALSSSDNAPKTVFSHIWIPPSIRREDVCAYHCSAAVLAELRSGKRNLADIGWRELESLVAELLSSNGMKVTLTRPSNDGGRDVIAEGEFFPGLRCTVAVEVTRSPKVTMKKLSSALYRNRHFPTVMVATSGQFTAGVLRERKEPENRLRLLLADGDCLSSWVSSGVPAFVP